MCGRFVGRLFFCLCIFHVCGSVAAQAPQSFLSDNDLLAERLSSLSDDEVPPEQVMEIVEHFRYYVRHPLDLNRASMADLDKAGFLGRYRIASLMDYRDTYGDILSLSELAAVPGFGKEYVDAISSLVRLHSYSPPGYSSSDGGGFGIDALLRVKYRAAGSDVSGNPLYKAIRVKADMPDGFSAGVGYMSPPGRGVTDPETVSGYFSYEPSGGFIKKIVVGDYNARFGQGGVMWSSFSLNSLSGMSGIMKTAYGITPYCTTGDGVRLRGAAVEVSAGEASVSLFGSYNVRSLKKSDVPFAGGLNASYGFDRMLFGITAVYGGMSCVSGDVRDCSLGLSLDGRFQIDHVSAYFEIALSDMVPAFWGGAELRASGRWDYSFAGRYVPAGYEALYPGAYSSDSSVGNEYAITVQARRRNGLMTDLNVGADAVYFPEQKADGAIGMFRMRGERSADRWRAVASVKYSLVPSSGKLSAALRGDCNFGVKPGDNVTGFSATARGDLSVATDFSSGGTGIGRSVGVEAGYRVSGRFSPKLSVFARLTLFHCDRWEERIYSYERDLYGSMYVPALYGKGFSAYALAVWKPFRFLKLSFKAGGMWHMRGEEKKKAGVADLKLQCELSF